MNHIHGIFLHGLLGSKEDWQDVIQLLQHKAPQLICHAFDLPFHHENNVVEVEDISQAALHLAQQIKSAVQNEPYILIGYSLGGRIALHYALKSSQKAPHLQAVILEGANWGLDSSQAREQRWQNDFAWATRFANEPLSQVLEDWYQQPVFAHLTPQERQQVIQKRLKNKGQHIARMMLATSLAKQPNYYPDILTYSSPLFYLCGERDQKFCAMVKNTPVHAQFISHAGHNAHLENPVDFTDKLIGILNHIK